MKTYILLSTLTLASVFADFSEEDLISARGKKNMPPPQPAHPERIVLTSAQPKSEYGWYIFADVLYWHADEGDGDWAFKDKKLGTGDGPLAPANITGNLNSGPNHSLKFKWDWAYRVGFGMNMGYDGWDGNAYYTWFHTHNSNGVGAKEGDQLVTDLDSSVNVFISGKMDWSIHYSMFDTELGRWFFVSKKLALRPHVGVKGGWINQTIHKYFNRGTLNVSPTQFATFTFKNDFSGVGPSAGFTSAWQFAEMSRDTFKMLGDFSGALMYGHFEISKKDKSFSSSGIITGNFPQKGLDRNLAVPMLKAMLAFNWNRVFNHDRNTFSLKVGYEFQFWFRQLHQWTTEQLFPPNIRYDLTPQDLVLQGITLDFRFDY